MDNYPDDIRSFDHDPRSPFYHDPTDTPEFEAQRTLIVRDNMTDLNGWLAESFSQAADNRLQELSDALLLPADEKSSLRIGDIVRQMVDDYCTPTDEQVTEELAEANTP